jgi:hypothetical protein
MNKHIDKNSLKHFAVNFICAAIGGTFGTGVGFGASLTKEWCDYNSYGHWCKTDFAFDTAGLILGTAVNKVVQYLTLKHIVY